MENKPPAYLLIEIREPSDLPQGATEGDLFERALEARNALREANSRLRALRALYGEE